MFMLVRPGVPGFTAGGPALLAWRLSRSGHCGVSGRRQWRGEAEEPEREPVRVTVAGAQLGGDIGDPVEVVGSP